jgi:hypothetical protein
MYYDSDHNAPAGLLEKRLPMYDYGNMPECVHLGYACRSGDRIAKNRYYVQRGESVDPLRQWYTESRAAYETWRPGGRLPYGAKVVKYRGDVPEVFR